MDLTVCDSRHSSTQMMLLVTVTETVAYTVQAEWRHHARRRRTGRKWSEGSRTRKLQQNQRSGGEERREREQATVREQDTRFETRDVPILGDTEDGF